MSVDWNTLTDPISEIGTKHTKKKSNLESRSQGRSLNVLAKQLKKYHALEMDGAEKLQDVISKNESLVQLVEIVDIEGDKVDTGYYKDRADAKFIWSNTREDIVELKCKSESYPNDRHYGRFGDDRVDRYIRENTWVYLAANTKTPELGMLGAFISPSELSEVTKTQTAYVPKNNTFGYYKNGDPRKVYKIDIRKYRPFRLDEPTPELRDALEFFLANAGKKK